MTRQKLAVITCCIELLVLGLVALSTLMWFLGILAIWLAYTLDRAQRILGYPTYPELLAIKKWFEKEPIRQRKMMKYCIMRFLRYRSPKCFIFSRVYVNVSGL